MKILYVGAPWGNSLSRQQALAALGHEVRSFDDDTLLRRVPRLLRALEWRLCNGPTTLRLNRGLLAAARAFRPDLTWVEMGKLIYPATLRAIKRDTGCILVNSYSDNFLDPMKKSRHYCRAIPLYDYIFTAQDHNFENYRRYGAKAVGKFWKGFNPRLHRPVVLSDAERAVYETDVVFVGHYEPSRREPMIQLARAVPRMKIWGHRWQQSDWPADLPGVVQGTGADGEDYPKALCGAKIAVQIMSRWSGDSQSSRSFEIPACGVFMLAERTEDHVNSYREDVEAAFFSTADELVAKARHYLAHDDERKRIAEAGRRRALESGYSNDKRIEAMLAEVLDKTAGTGSEGQRGGHEGLLRSGVPRR